ncbi:GAF domain-containing protein [bacterium]|nr:GAF domain-containing protein [bacterium]
MHRLRPYWRPLLAAALALPLLIGAVAVSAPWIGRSFPGFLVLHDGVVPTVSAFDWPSDRRALFHSQVVAVDGRPAADSAAIYAAVADRPAGTLVQYRMQRDGAERAITLPVRQFGIGDYLQTYGVLLLFGGIWLACGLVVGVLQPRSRQARVFLLQSAIAGLYPISAVFLYQPGLAWLGWLPVALECLLGATWIHLALVFPVERPLGGWRRSAAVGAYALGGALAIAAVHGLAEAPPRLGWLHAEYAFSAFGVSAFVLALVAGYREHPSGPVRARIKALLPGAVLAGSLAAYALLNAALAGRDFPVQFGLLLSPVFCVSVGYAIAKHDLFDVDRVVRQSFVYALLTLVVLAAYALTLAVSARALPASDRLTAVLSMAFVALLAFVLEPLRLAIQRAVDRAFFRSPVDYRKTLADLGEAMTTLLHTEDIAAELTRVGTEVVQLEAAGLALVEYGGAPRYWLRRADAAPVHGIAPAGIAPLCRAADALGRPALVEEHLPGIADPAARADAERFLAAHRLEVALPLTFDGVVIGGLLLGRRRSGRTVSSEDIRLLRTLASQAAIALQNARSYQALETLTRELDSQVQHRTAELRISNEQLSQAYDDLKRAQAQIVQSAKMASLGQLVAGVAHELNNPASFIHGGLQNLSRALDRLVRLLQAHEAIAPADPADAERLAAIRREIRLDTLLQDVPALLRICAEGSERVKKIVDDLRVFVRADQGDRAPVDVAQSIDATLALLGDRIERGGVTVHRDYPPVPPIDGQAGQLNQVWMNLLVNALDALEGVADPTLTISVRAAGEADARRIEVTVRDNGAGMDEATRARAFEPFFTTKPIGRGTGLGLSIAFGAVQSHGGSIDIESAGGEGTSVVVRLPLADRPR